MVGMPEVPREVADDRNGSAAADEHGRAVQHFAERFRRHLNGRMVRIHHQAAGPRSARALRSGCPPGVFSLTNSLKAATTLSGSWFGTRRMLTLAVALAGITVLAPAPVKPPAMPWTSSVGRAQILLEHRIAGSPVSCVEPTSFFRNSFSLNGRLVPALLLGRRRAARRRRRCPGSGCARRRSSAFASSSTSPKTAFGAAPP